MTFSSGIYHQNVAPAQIDVSLQAPILQNQVKGLETFFGEGLEAFSEIFETRERYKTQMAQIAQENDKRAAQLVEGGISSTDAINMAWEETRYMVPKTWGEVGKQNAISDLAIKANNGFISGESSALTLETAMAEIEEIKRSGLDGVPLEDLDWIDGSGFRALANATRPNSETMIALGPNASWVRNQILNRLTVISDEYTEKERQANLQQYISNGQANIRNMLDIDLRGEQVPSQLVNEVNDFIKKNPKDAKDYAKELGIEMIKKSSYNGSIFDGRETYENLQTFLGSFGIYLSPMEADKIIHEAAMMGNKIENDRIKEISSDSSKALNELSIEEIQDPSKTIQILIDNGFDEEMINETFNDDMVLDKNENFNLPLDAMLLEIQKGNRTVSDGEALIRRMAPYSIPLQLKWDTLFQKAQFGANARARGNASLALQMRRERTENFNAGNQYYKSYTEGIFSPDAIHDIDGELKSLNPGVAATAQLGVSRQALEIRRDYVNGVISLEQADQLIQDINDLTLDGLLLNPNSFVQLQPEQTEPTQTTNLTGGIRVR